MPTLTANNLNLAQCERIISNQYRSANCLYDYQQEEVDQRYLYLISKEAERNIKRLETIANSNKMTLKTDFNPQLPTILPTIPKNEIEELISVFKPQLNQLNEFWRLADGSMVEIPLEIIPF